jgi:hypothetical protein
MRWCLRLALLAGALVLAAAVKTDDPDATRGLYPVNPEQEAAAARAYKGSIATSLPPVRAGGIFNAEAQGWQAVAAARAAGYDPGSQGEQFEWMVEQAVGVINPPVPAAANASSDGASGWKFVWHALFLR